MKTTMNNRDEKQQSRKPTIVIPEILGSVSVYRGGELISTKPLPAAERISL